MSYVAINHRFGLPETIKKLIFPVSRSGEDKEIRRRSNTNIPIDILESPKDNMKRKREDCDDREQECKYIRLERRLPQNLVKKFRLPEDADGVLTVTVEKVRPQPPKPKTLQIVIS
ncbi:hypothetical protein Bca52824_081055 [Brassica carinata]|uniref:SHSP domain-containing protein n=1 Tax=Brassica carinata TaxID=52824 RepID=A0A8X7TR65_BRACI|nr:hypothetical protein Bca52824_081055 [Brassica carinata]